MGEQEGSGIVESLATQFSSATDCFRELVQNSIDAGSPQVEVWIEYAPGKGHQGLIAIHVDDFGEGMDEQIIDNQLTKLFASAKEGDLTKIGKFGIGFVSIFAMRPQAVLMHTGRGGEYWEVLFHEDRSFTKSRLEQPVEGTQLTLLIEGDVVRLRELVGQVRAALKRWCTHSEAEVTFEDRTQPHPERELINEPFDIKALCTVRVEHPGTEIVLGYAESPSYSFYNRGLMLFHSEQAEPAVGPRHRRYGHITFKMKSRYLEHTLSRESLVQDEQFERAMVLLDEAANGPLLDALVGELEALVGKPTWSAADIARYGELLRFLALEPASSWARVAHRAIIATLRGPAMSLAALYEAWRERGAMLYAEAPSALIEQIEARGVPVLFGRKSWGGRADLGAAAQLFARYAGARVDELTRTKLRRAGEALLGRASLDGAQQVSQTLATPGELYLHVQLDADTSAYDALLTRTQWLLAQVGHDYRRLVTCQLDAPEADPPLFVIGPTLDVLMMRPKLLGALERGVTHLWRAPWHRWEVAINRDHPHFAQLAQLARAGHLNLAAYCLARALFLTQELPVDPTSSLLQFARQER